MAPILLTVSYTLDVVALVAFGLISYGFSRITPNYHPFSLVDLSISYPYKGDTVTDADLILASVLAPAVIILLVVLILVPGLATLRVMPRKEIVWRKLWELFVGWMGLALSLITQFLIVQGLKNAVGKPRPDMLSRCIPDLSDVAAYAVGGYGQQITERWVLVNQTICQQTDKAILNDGFRSFPSGHSGTSFAGLLYLTLWLCSKFGAWFPYLPPSAIPLLPSSYRSPVNPAGSSVASKPRYSTRVQPSSYSITQLRDEAAAPPAWLLFLIYVPVGAAMYICASRYFDYKHHGFDILSGAVIGIVTAVLAHRWYHLPPGRSAGWAWGPRTRARALGIGVGAYGFVDEDAYASYGGSTGLLYNGPTSAGYNRGGSTQRQALLGGGGYGQQRGSDSGLGSGTRPLSEEVDLEMGSTTGGVGGGGGGGGGRVG